MEKHREECLVCGAPLKFLEQPVEMECALCHKMFINNVCCESGHYVCDECHISGIDQITGICLGETSSNPFVVLEKMMSLPACHMHGPEHHFMVGASLITAYHNACGEVDMQWALGEIMRRAKQVPGGACGNWGACGAAISTGMFVSIVTKSSPLAKEAWKLSNQMTSRSLAQVAEYGGPRCCKRDSYLSVLTAIDFAADKLGIKMERPEKITCSRSAFNNQCLGIKCPFHPVVYKVNF
ncbi:DUF5714 domain-containing protein [Prevotella sp. KH2C16]|uniref:DUF5714 domain-containing protein n=1 Tax=Prevotella sp. KH2C16 TaxID=1855325 RepID=UPI0008F0FE4C|nr:DUF5714 domain-containing protein [Prevotella sp. KH2C16]SFG27288.1 hypothetical protein SAMN05216383_108103 [Prevotella sp. KH2C16]